MADGVRGNNLSVIAWCTELVTRQPSLIRRPDSNVENLKDLVRAKLDDSQTPELVSLAAAIGVAVPDTTAPDES
jgi:hypothetical protein